MNASPVLRRKTRPAAVATDAPSPARLWRRSVVHGLARIAGLTAAVEDVGFDAGGPETLPALVGEGALVALLEGPAGFALAILDAEVMAALVEVQTLGRVLSRPVAPRAPTSIDAAMITDPLDRMLAAHDLLVEGGGSAPEAPKPKPAGKGAGQGTGSGAETDATSADDETWQGPRNAGFRYATQIKRVDQITPALADVQHHTVRFDLDLGSGARRGAIVLAFPEPPDARAGPSGGRAADVEWSDSIEATVMQTEMPLRAALGRLHRPIQDVTALQVGDILALPRMSLDQVRLTTPGGDTLAMGRLGRTGSVKAVRIDPTAIRPMPAFEAGQLPSQSKG